MRFCIQLKNMFLFYYDFAGNEQWTKWHFPQSCISAISVRFTGIWIVQGTKYHNKLELYSESISWGKYSTTWNWCLAQELGCSNISRSKIKIKNCKRKEKWIKPIYLDAFFNLVSMDRFMICVLKSNQSNYNNYVNTYIILVLYSLCVYHFKFYSIIILYFFFINIVLCGIM